MQAKGSDPRADEDAVARGLDEAQVRLDPFAAGLRFAARVAEPRILTAADRPGIRAVRRMDADVEGRMDLDQIERWREWAGALREARPMNPGGLPAEVEEPMREKERQFILRNLGRAERIVDPDGPLPYTTEFVEWPTIEDAYARTRGYAHQTPRMLEQSNLDVVRSELAWRRRMHRGIKWGERFGHEVKQTLTGPMWKHDPEAQAEREDTAETTAAATEKG